MEHKSKEILEILKRENSLKLTEICKLTYLSRSSVRRVLIALEQQGLVKRYYGGVSLVSKSISEKPYNIRASENIKLKELICAKAASFVRDHSVIFIDSSSTTYYLLSHLKNFNHITIITNSIEIALYFKDYSSIKVYLTPGYLKTNSVSIIGEFASEFLDHFKADLAFYSCKAFDYDSFYEGDELQANVKKRMMKNAKLNIVLCDSSKFNKSAYFRLCNFKDIDYLISDLELNDDLALLLESSNCTYLKA